MKAPPETYGPAVKSVAAPPEIEEVLEKMRQAQAAGKPTEALRKALFAAIALHRHDSEVSTIQAKHGRKGKPEVLVITAKRHEAGRERAELLYEAVRAGAALTTPAEVTGGAEGPSEISSILERMQSEKGKSVLPPSCARPFTRPSTGSSRTRKRARKPLRPYPATPRC
ncbi:MAG: hypothetical protein M5R42_17670 [Rhodocyclaceae bacterium]|nr:hypothetical protein [Rhodocyclaceae bacterium]